MMQIDKSPRAIVHVGAHLGQEIGRYLALKPEIIVWIEADPDVFAQLEMMLATARERHPRVRQLAFNRLVADADGGEVTFHRFSNGGKSSSMFAATPRLQQQWPHVTEVSTVELRTSRLDTVLSEAGLRPEEVGFLVLDVQGAELLALKGAGRYLDFVEILQVEVSSEAIYEGGVLLPELHAHLSGLGFTSGGTARWHGDAVYHRPPIAGSRAFREPALAPASPPPARGPGRYRGQYGQDRFVHETFFPNQAKGVFFEAGVADGERISNTLFFERTLGWTGLLVEANPMFAERARQVRKAPVAHCALADVEEPMLFLDAGLLGGLVRHMPMQQVRQIERRAAREASLPELQLSWVRGRRLDNLLLEHGITHIDYLSLDLEGGEPAALATLDFAKVRVNVMTIEAKGPNKARLLAMLGTHGFRLHGEVKEDVVMVHETFTPL
ncbi:FkbM family methyltransferase [Roseomonas fluvialis]|nr:FkbM family methyltransferase [Roseomonas fluvialis]